MARLIDKDAYLKDLEKIMDELQKIVDKEDCDKELAMFQISLLSACVLKLTEQPTIEAEPVKHGKWIISSDGYYPYCSECHYRQEKHMTNYCPDCGARMDGDENA